MEATGVRTRRGTEERIYERLKAIREAREKKRE